MVFSCLEPSLTRGRVSRRGDGAPVTCGPARLRCEGWTRGAGSGLVAQWESTVLAGRAVGVRLPAGPPADRRTWVITWLLTRPPRGDLPTTAPRSPFDDGHGLVAQLGEHRLRMAGCRGSSPRRSTEVNTYRDVVQSGRTLASGARARGFESLHPDHEELMDRWRLGYLPQAIRSLVRCLSI